MSDLNLYVRVNLLLWKVIAKGPVNNNRRVKFIIYVSFFSHYYAVHYSNLEKNFETCFISLLMAQVNFFLMQVTVNSLVLCRISGLCTMSHLTEQSCL